MKCTKYLRMGGAAPGGQERGIRVRVTGLEFLCATYWLNNLRKWPTLHEP